MTSRSLLLCCLVAGASQLSSGCCWHRPLFWRFGCCRPVVAPAAGPAAAPAPTVIVAPVAAGPQLSAPPMAGPPVAGPYPGGGDFGHGFTSFAPPTGDGPAPAGGPIPVTTFHSGPGYNGPDYGGPGPGGPVEFNGPPVYSAPPPTGYPPMPQGVPVQTAPPAGAQLHHPTPLPMAGPK